MFGGPSMLDQSMWIYDGDDLHPLLISDVRIGSSTNDYLFNTNVSNDGVAIGGQWTTYDREEGGPVTQSPRLLIYREDVTDHPPIVGLAANDGGARAFTMTYLRSRGTPDNFEIVEDGDVIGQYFFEAFDGNSFIRGGIIGCEVQGTPSTEEMPMAIVFKNTETIDPQEVGRIGPTGDWTFGGVYTNPAHTLSQSGSVIHNQKNSQVGDFLIKGQNTSDLFFTDASLDAAAIGTTTLGSTIRIGASNTTAFNDKFTINTSGNSDTFSLTIKRRTSNVERPGRIVGYRERGTATAVNVKTGDPLFEIWGTGYNGTDSSKAARIRFEAGDSDFSTSTSPGAIVFDTMPDSSYTFATALKIDERQSIIASGRIQGAKGADVASGSVTTLGNDGNLFDITGGVNIDYITGDNWQAGSSVVLRFKAALTLQHNTAPLNASTKPLYLVGAANLAVAVDEVIRFTFDGSKWYQEK